MSVELEEIRDFLAGSEPFSQLPDNELDELPSKMTMEYFRRGEVITQFGEQSDHMRVIRSGAVDVLDEQGVLLDRREAGRSFGYSTMTGDPTSRYTMVAVEDSLVLRLSRTEFLPLSERNPQLSRYYSSWSKRIRAAADQLRQESNSKVLRTRLAEFKIANPVWVGPECSIREAAQTMEDNRVSSLLIQRGEELLGIATDRDMRGRVVAAGLDPALPVSEIMTPNPRCATSQDLAFEAMLLMAELRIHHLPIVDEGRVSGIVTSADIMRLLQHDPIYLTADLSRKNSVEELADSYQSAAGVASRFIDRGASAEEVSSLLTVAGDSLARRLLTLAEEELGPPPVPYGFAVVGSQGRRAVGFASDQDNCLVLSDDYDEDAHGGYFAALSARVCDGLAAAGQVYCPGDMMASNPAWRMTVGQWADRFHTWVTAPDPDALLYAQTFFDMRVVHGSRDLVEQVHRSAVASATGSGRLHAQLAALAVRREPPLGVFRGLVVRRGGDYANTLDVKKGGIAAIVQIARLYALVAGSPVVETGQRLAAAAQAGVISAKGARDLTDAFGVLKGLSLRHQARQLRAGETTDYAVSPDLLGRLERENLRDAFGIIKSIQSALTTAYPVRST